ncbi:MAG: glycosyltransferase family 4 protein [Thermofilaceae archaeon]
MILLHIVQAYDGGGVSNVIVNLVKAFSKHGHCNIAVTPKCSKKYTSVFNECIEITLLTLLKPYNSYMYGSLVSWNLLKELEKLPYSPDSIIVHPGWYAATVRNLVKKYTDTPIVVVNHGTYLNELRFMKYHPLTGYDRVKYLLGIKLSHKNEIAVLKSISSISNKIKVIAVSRRTCEELIDSGVRASNTYAILNGVDKNLFKPVDKSSAEEVLEKKYGVKVKGFTIVHVGLGPIKGTHMLIKSLAMLKKRGVKFTALLAGKLSLGSYKQYLEDLINRTRLSENVKFLGWVHEEDLPYLYSVADVTVVPSYSEGSPLVIPESLACATPVIATKVGGNEEYLRIAGLQKLLIDFANYDFSLDLFRKVDYCIHTLDSLLEKIGARISDIPSWLEVAKEYIKILKN